MTKRPAKASRTNRRKFLWLDQVKADDELPRSAFVVAFELMQGFNAKYGGAAWKSIETLATDTGLSEPSIVRITRQLVNHGHLKVDPGKGGRGHSNRYFMVQKTSADGAFKATGKGSAGESKGSVGGVDSLKIHLMEEANASSNGERERRSRSLAVIPGAPAPYGGALEGLKERFAALWALWDSHRNFPDTDEDEAKAWQAYVAIVPHEVDPGELHPRAEAHIAGLKVNGLKVGDLWKWLSRNNWRKEPAPKPTRKSREPSSGQVLLDKYGGRS